MSTTSTLALFFGRIYLKTRWEWAYRWCWIMWAGHRTNNQNVKNNNRAAGWIGGSFFAQRPRGSARRGFARGSTSFARTSIDESSGKRGSRDRLSNASIERSPDKYL
jgi:hypothetical protein